MFQRFTECCLSYNCFCLRLQLQVSTKKTIFFQFGSPKQLFNFVWKASKPHGYSCPEPAGRYVLLMTVMRSIAF